MLSDYPFFSEALGEDPSAGDAEELIDDEQFQAGEIKYTADSWCELPRDLIEAILVRLPVSDLFRFRGVCVRWNQCFL